MIEEAVFFVTSVQIKDRVEKKVNVEEECIKITDTFFYCNCREDKYSIYIGQV
jgi:hypothetical protein